MSAQEKARAEVAADLRACAVDTLDGMSFQRRLAEIVGVPNGTWRQVMKRLAGLIDRPTCGMRRVEDGVTETYYVCSSCGADFDMRSVENGPWNYCPNCGGKVTDDGDD